MSFHGASPISFGTVSMVTATLGGNDPEVGTRRSYAGEDYIFVYNSGSSTVGVGNFATISLNSGYSVTVSTTTSVDFVAGICKHVAIPTGSYGYLLTKGFAKIKMQADNSAAAGQIIAIAADGEVALKSNSTGYPSPAIGKVLTALASGASGMAYITCI